MIERETTGVSFALRMRTTRSGLGVKVSTTVVLPLWSYLLPTTFLRAGGRRKSSSLVSPNTSILHLHTKAISVALRAQYTVQGDQSLSRAQ